MLPNEQNGPEIFELGPDTLTEAEYLDALEEETDTYFDNTYDHDDMYDTDSAFGSCGWGTDEYYN